MADRSVPTRLFVRWILYPLQAILIGSVYFIVRALPLSWAAGTGSFLFRHIMPHMRVSRVARQNVGRVFPELSAPEVEALLIRIWDNLGRGAGEFAHLDRFTANEPGARVELVGLEHLIAMRDGDKAGIIFAAHLGNWELGARMIGEHCKKLGQIYRGADNPYIDRLFRNARSSMDATLVPKGREGAATMLRLMRNGLSFGVMMDQKLNEGVAIPFFGHDAMTATAPIDLALRTGGPIISARCVRLPDSHFRIEIFPPLELERTGDRKADVKEALVQINGILEDWIRENPEQWFWLHRRWPKE